MKNDDFDVNLDLDALKRELSQPKLTPDQLQQALQRYVDALSGMDGERFRSVLRALFARDVYFKDPFHEVRGLAELERVYAHLFQRYPDAAFHFHLHAGTGDTGYVEWRLHYHESGRPMQRNGISKLLFDEYGKVRVQMDYWDSGEYYFRRLPLLGGLLNWLADKQGAK